MIKLETNEVSVRYIFNMAKSTYRYDDFKVRVEFIFSSLYCRYSHINTLSWGEFLARKGTLPLWDVVDQESVCSTLTDLIIQITLGTLRVEA